MSYRFTMDEEVVSSSVVEFCTEAGIRLARILPKAELVKIDETTMRFRWVAVGVKYYHPIYVYVSRSGNDSHLLLVNKVPYPAYLLGLAGALALGGLYVATVTRVGSELRAILVQDRSVAGELVSRLIKGHNIVTCSRFLEMRDISFEGYLYKLPIGYIAFMDKKPKLRHVDVITEHEEKDGWIEPVKIGLGALLKNLEKLMSG